MKPEDSIHISIIEYMAWKYPDVLVIHIPNGGSRNVIEATKLKRMGVRPGVPDLFIPVSSKLSLQSIKPKIELGIMWKDCVLAYNGFFCEIKAGKNKPTTLQKEMMQKLFDLGYYCCTVWSLEEFIKEWEWYHGK